MKEPIWTAENMNKKKGDTTFSQCGWCEWAGGGFCRYGCHLKTSCSLLKSYGLGSDVKWDTQCIVKKLAKKDIESVVRSKNYHKESLLKQIKDVDSEIGQLRKIKAKDNPPLPENRIDPYEVGEVLYVFTENKWNRGICVNGYRHNDGCVSYVLDDYPDSQKGWGCGTGVPCVLKEWEYKYFKSNLDDFKTWLEFSDKKYNGDSLDIKSYYDAMAQ